MWPLAEGLGHVKTWMNNILVDCRLRLKCGGETQSFGKVSHLSNIMLMFLFVDLS